MSTERRRGIIHAVLAVVPEAQKRVAELRGKLVLRRQAVKVGLGYLERFLLLFLHALEFGKQISFSEASLRGEVAKDGLRSRRSNTSLQLGVLGL